MSAPVDERHIPRFAAEPPQEGRPYGRFEARLREALLDACLHLDTQGTDLGDVGEIVWHPDRGWHGRVYVPATMPTAAGYEVFGHVRFVAPGDEAEEDPGRLFAVADYTEETAERHPDWRIDICDEVIGSWRGEGGAVAAMTLVWGHALMSGATSAIALLGDLVVDRCDVVDGRFTLIAPDDYRGDTLEVALLDRKGAELARESLYE